MTSDGANHAVASMRDFAWQARHAMRIRTAEKVVSASILLLLLAGVFGAVGVVMLVVAVNSPDAPDRLETFGAGALGALMGAVFIGAAVAALLARAKRWRRRRAAAHMAIAAGWHYNLEHDPRWYAGVLFRTGVRGWVESSMHVHEPRFVEVANYAFQPEVGTTSGLKGIEEIGFVRVPLERPLPHMYLQAQRRKTPRPYGFPFAGSQHLSLEGDFDRYFRLYVPREYERDALYVFTPDLMALLIDELAGCDVEIIDDELYVYASRGFDVTRPLVLAVATRIADTFGRRTAKQSVRYVDERTQDPLYVDASGVRLKPATRALITGGPGCATLAMLAVVAWQQGLFG